VRIIRGLNCLIFKQISKRSITEPIILSHKNENILSYWLGRQYSGTMITCEIKKVYRNNAGYNNL
jgi:hypothetical protein